MVTDQLMLSADARLVVLRPVVARHRSVADRARFDNAAFTIGTNETAGKRDQPAFARSLIPLPLSHTRRGRS
jgi:hypothetical protein